MADKKRKKYTIKEMEDAKYKALVTSTAKKARMQKKFLKGLVDNKCLITYTAKATKISRSTHYKWMRTDENYAELVNEILDAQVEAVEGKLLNLIDNENTAAVIFYLKHRSKNYQQALKIEAEVKGDITINAMFNEDLIKDADEPNED